jgi:hypothetical protein
MANQAINSAVQHLKQEHIRLCKELARVDDALSVLTSLENIPVKMVESKVAATKGKRKISASARKKMSEAARARWAARKNEKTSAK